MSEWQPIETAPRGSDCVLLAWRTDEGWQVAPGSMKTSKSRPHGYWVIAVMDIDYLNGGDGQRFSDFSAEPTHWMPLPEPPK